MSETPASDARVSGRDAAPEPVRAQILATEHWSLLATRSMVWNESFSRASWFVTVLSAAMVALALVAQATGFGTGFRLFAILVLPVVVLVGLATLIRLMEVNAEDAWLVAGMNRLRHAYLELAPELDQIFVTGHHDDKAGIIQSYGPAVRIRALDYLSSTPMLVGTIDAVVVGALVGLLLDALGAEAPISIALGVLTTLAAVATLLAVIVKYGDRMWGAVTPRFPTALLPGPDESPRRD